MKIDSKAGIKTQAILNFTLYSSLCLLTFYIYLYKRIGKLTEKYFHITMFAMLSLVYFCAIFDNSIKLLSLSYESTRLSLGYWIMSQLQYCVNCLVHSVFAVKYWGLARKVQNLAY